MLNAYNLITISVYIYEYIHLYVVITVNYIVTMYLNHSAQYWKQSYHYYIV